ncbi:hypothetical protein I3843_01G012300 [Carya illinoinensis]|uniref:Uncharacterized protein n=1 Tax=Carya illinoinensis TaxID=32201 RepID=A0A8T1RHS0_CARIL|nr:hypothetical protein I3760_01G011200 [Carya illinoinensis]KAG6666165.1 hypothetical protein CIPAW_01G012300 [Carya illinoinensis]KAG7993591.1 hypothetical protein I3843_01G012300 [Carya illinoinensis]
MRQQLFLVLLVLIMILVLTQPSLVDSRTLGPESKKRKADDPEAVDGRESVREASFTSTSSAGSIGGGRVLVRDRVFTLASGPSRKGSGH